MEVSNYGHHDQFSSAFFDALCCLGSADCSRFRSAEDSSNELPQLMRKSKHVCGKKRVMLRLGVEQNSASIVHYVGKLFYFHLVSFDWSPGHPSPICTFPIRRGACSCSGPLRWPGWLL